jgi:hypothetical protein
MSLIDEVLEETNAKTTQEDAEIEELKTFLEKFDNDRARIYALGNLLFDIPYLSGWISHAIQHGEKDEFEHVANLLVSCGYTEVSCRLEVASE